MKDDIFPLYLLCISTWPITHPSTFNGLVPDPSIYLIELFINQIAGSEQSTLALYDGNNLINSIKIFPKDIITFHILRLYKKWI